MYQTPVKCIYSFVPYNVRIWRPLVVSKCISPWQVADLGGAQLTLGQHVGACDLVLAGAFGGGSSSVYP